MASFVRPFSSSVQQQFSQPQVGPRPQVHPQTIYRYTPPSNRDYFARQRNALAQDREDRIAHYQEMQQRLAEAKEARAEAEHRAAFEKQMKYETMMTAAIKKIGHINPADPDAGEKWNQIFQEHPELFHTEKGLPSLTPYYEQFQRLNASAQAARERQQAAADAQKARQEEINQRRQENADLRKELQEGRLSSEAARAKERAEDKRDAALGVARSKYESASEKAADARQEMTDTQAEIDRLKGKGKLSDEDKYHLDRMVVSAAKWKQKMQENQATAKGLEKQFPELSPDYVPPEEKDTTAAPTPVNPNVTDTAQPDVPAIRQTAPVSGGTATPTGDMVPLNPDGSPGESETLAKPSEWDDLTEKLHEANRLGEEARSKRLTAMDTLAKAKWTDYLNPLSTTMDDAQKAVEEASADIDKHDATYKDIFDKRGALLKRQQPQGTTPVAPAAPAAPAVPAANAATPAEPHPYEGKRVRQKSTGQYGTFVNGQFVPEEQEEMQDQPTPDLAETE